MNAVAGQVRVRDRNGVLAIRADGVLLDGDRVDVVRSGESLRVPIAMIDSQPARPSAATLASAAHILGDAYNEAELASLSDEAARHAVVRKRIGAAANGRGAAYLDGAWGALAGTGAAAAIASTPVAAKVPVGMTDEHAARGREGVRQALADAAAARGTPQRPGMMTDGDRQAANDRTRGAYVAMKCEMGDAWRGGPPPETKLAPHTEAMFRSGKITDSPTNRARAELAQQLQDGWKEGRK